MACYSPKKIAYVGTKKCFCFYPLAIHTEGIAYQAADNKSFKESLTELVFLESNPRDMSCSVTERVTSRAGGGAGTSASSSAISKCRGQSLVTLTTSPNHRSEGPGHRPPQNGPHSSPVQEVPRDYSFRSKPCCTFLWCCCCKCLCSNPGNKGSEENGGATKNSISELDSEVFTQYADGMWRVHRMRRKRTQTEQWPPRNVTITLVLDKNTRFFTGRLDMPTLDEIRSWGKNFDKLMKSPAGRKVFRDFLKGEYSEENILFWLACEDLRKQTSKDVVEEKARHIYEDFISILSPREVSLDSRVREIVNRNMVEPTTSTFDEAQLQIYLLMNRDSYPRFVNSQMYKSLAQIDKIEREKQTTSSASSIASTDLNASAIQTHHSTSSGIASAATPLLSTNEEQKEQVVPTSTTVRDQHDVK